MSFGRLERTPGAQPMSEINMTPLVDVMLVLLVIFMVAAPVMAGAIRLNLPQAQATTPAASAALSVTLTVDSQGQVFLDDQPIEAQALEQHLRELASQDTNTEVQLRADSAVAYGRMVEIMGLVHAAGLQRIGFMAQPEPPSAGTPAAKPPARATPKPTPSSRSNPAPLPVSRAVVGPAGAPSHSDRAVP